MEFNKDSHAISSINQCKIIDLDRHTHENGSLSVVQNTQEFPFEIKRVYYLYDIPGDAERGGHSHFNEQRLIIAVSGCFDVTVDDGHEIRKFTLNRPYKALYIPAGIWRNLDNFSSGSVCLALASNLYDPEDYVRDYKEFKMLTKNKL